MGQSTAMDLVRRGVDAAMIFGSLLMLTWPSMFARPGTNPLVAVGVVVCLGVGVIAMAGRWPLLQYAPIASAVVMAGWWHYHDGAVSPELTGLLIVVSAIILVRQIGRASCRERV